MMVVAAMVMLATRLGMLSGTITLVMICKGVAPMLWAASMTPGSTSRMLVSIRRETNGKDAMTSGTREATVPMDVPTIKRDSGMTHLGSGRMPLGSPVTSSTPKGRPMTSASRVATTVDQTVSQVSNGMVGRICKKVCQSLPAKNSAISCSPPHR